MKNCANKEHKHPCSKKDFCKECGKSTCAPNFAYHVCVKERTRQIGEDSKGRPLFIGDTVEVQQCWEDEAGYLHDESGITVSGVNKDGTLRFRFGDWKTRNSNDQKIQAFMNSCEWYPKDVQKQLV